MNKEKISKFLLELRKSKNMTQQELADKLYISDKAVSKWERGICIPDITTFKLIADVFNVSVAELVNGERINTNNMIGTYDKIFINNISNNNKIIKKKNVIIMFLLLLILLIFTSLLAFYFINTYDKISTYQFGGNSKNFTLNSGKIIFSKGDGMIDIKSLDLVEGSDIISHDVSSGKILVSFGEFNYASDTYDEDDKKQYSFSDWLKYQVHFYESKNNFCDGNCGHGVFAIINKNDFLNDLEIKIEYCIDGECKSENLNIYKNELVTSTLF